VDCGVVKSEQLLAELASSNLAELKLQGSFSCEEMVAGTPHQALTTKIEIVPRISTHISAASGTAQP